MATLIDFGMMGSYYVLSHQIKRPFISSAKYSEQVIIAKGNKFEGIEAIY